MKKETILILAQAAGNIIVIAILLCILFRDTKVVSDNKPDIAKTEAVKVEQIKPQPVEFITYNVQMSEPWHVLPNTGNTWVCKIKDNSNNKEFVVISVGGYGVSMIESKPQ